MISFLPLSFFLLILQKSIFFFSSSMVLDLNFLYMVSIFPLIFFLLFLILFNFSDSVDLNSYSLIFFFLLLFLFFCFCSELPLLFLFFLESSVLFMVLFIFNFSKDHDKVSSTIFMFFLNSLGSIPFMYFCSSFPFPLQTYNFSNSWSLEFFPFFLFLLILCSKLPIFLLHFWLTKAHVSASGSGSMILASLMLKLGSFGLLKFCPLFLSIFFISFKNFLVSFSLFGSLFLAILMNRFFDLKYVVACSSIVHMAFIFPFLLQFNFVGVISCILMMVGHGIISCFIFFLITLLYELSLNRSSDLSKSVEGFSKSLTLFLFLFFLMNLGFPPFMSFVSELFFMALILGYGVGCVFLFCFILVLSGKVFMTIVLSILFSKKNLSLSGGISPSISLFSIVYFFSFALSPLLF